MEQKYAVDISGLSDISELCRLCLTRTGSMHALYSISENEYCTLFDKLQRLSAEPLNKSKKYPSYLCLKCVCTLNLAYLLTEQLKTTHQQLTQYFQGINDKVRKGVTDTYSTDNLSLRMSSKSRDSASYNENNCGDTNLDSLNHSPLKLDGPVREEIMVPDKCIDETNIQALDANEKLQCTEESGSHLVRKRQFLGNSESTIQISKKICSSEEGSAIEGAINSEDFFGDNSKDTQRSAFSRLSRISKISIKKCKESFSKPSKLMRQNPRCHQQLNITCNICSKSYPNLKALTGHVKLKHEGMLFECQKCMKKFKSSCTFKNHINGHTIQDIYADVNNTITSQVTATHENVTQINLKESETMRKVMGTRNLSETVENITTKVKETETKENEPSSKKIQPEVNVSLMETKRRQQKIIQPERNKTLPDHELETERKENKSAIQESTPVRTKHITRVAESIKESKTMESERMGSGTSAIKESKTEIQKTVTESKIHIPEHEQNTKHIAETKEITSVITDQHYDEKENAANSKNNKANKKKGETVKHKPGLVKPHKCEHCSKNFSTKFKLHQHMSLHKKESNICDVCGVGFVSNIRLEIHRMKYPGQTPCGFCAETFINSRYLSMHMQLLHSTKSV